MCQTVCATNSLVRKISACLCTAYSRQTEAGVARALISRLKAAEFLPNSWLFEVRGVDQYQGWQWEWPLRARALSEYRVYSSLQQQTD
jgi:hypothetical protein